MTIAITATTKLCMFNLPKKKKKTLHVQKSINNQENKANYSETKNMNIG